MEDKIQIMVVKIGENDYGLEMSEIRKVVKSRAVSHPPEKNVSYMAGILSPDGIPIPVIDIHQKLGTIPVTSCDIEIILASRKRMLAVSVDSAERIVNVAPECCHIVPKIMEKAGRPWICRIAEFDGRLVPVISAERLFAEVGEKND